MNWKQDGQVLLGAVIGGVLGYFGFFWLRSQGFYGLALPGGLVGCGAGLFRTKSNYVAVICGILALGFGLFTEWRFAPFKADAGFGYFLTHVFQLRPLTLIMIVAGTVVGFWIPFRRTQEITSPAQAD